MDPKRPPRVYRFPPKPPKTSTYLPEIGSSSSSIPQPETHGSSEEEAQTIEVPKSTKLIVIGSSSSSIPQPETLESSGEESQTIEVPKSTKLIVIGSSSSSIPQPETLGSSEEESQTIEVPKSTKLIVIGSSSSSIPQPETLGSSEKEAQTIETPRSPNLIVIGSLSLSVPQPETIVSSEEEAQTIETPRSPNLIVIGSSPSSVPRPETLGSSEDNAEILVVPKPKILGVFFDGAFISASGMFYSQSEKVTLNRQPIEIQPLFKGKVGRTSSERVTVFEKLKDMSGDVCVISVPMHFTNGQKFVIRRELILCGFNHCFFVNLSLAVAIGYKYQNVAFFKVNYDRQFVMFIQAHRASVRLALVKYLGDLVSLVHCLYDRTLTPTESVTETYLIEFETLLEKFSNSSIIGLKHATKLVLGGKFSQSSELIEILEARFKLPVERSVSNICGGAAIVLGSKLMEDSAPNCSPTNLVGHFDIGNITFVWGDHTCLLCGLDANSINCDAASYLVDGMRLEDQAFEEKIRTAFAAHVDSVRNEMFGEEEYWAGFDDDIQESYASFRRDYIRNNRRTTHPQAAFVECEACFTKICRKCETDGCKWCKFKAANLLDKNGSK